MYFLFKTFILRPMLSHINIKLFFKFPKNSSWDHFGISLKLLIDWAILTSLKYYLSLSVNKVYCPINPNLPFYPSMKLYNFLLKLLFRFMPIYFIVWFTMEASFFFLYSLFGHCWYKGMLLILNLDFCFQQSCSNLLSTLIVQRLVLIINS